MKTFNKILPITMITAGLLLLGLELVDYMNQIKVEELVKDMETVSLLKYKEDSYIYFLLWIILLITGISFWINKKLYWSLTQICTAIFLLSYIMLPLYLRYETTKVILFTTITISLIISCYFSNKKESLQRLNITPKNVYYTIIGGVIGSLITLYINYNIY